MGSLSAKGGRETVNGSFAVWRPWQLKQLDLSEGRAITTPSIRHFFQEYVLVCMQSGVAHYQHRNIIINGQVVDGMLFVVEPGETWTSQAKNATFCSLCIDPAWLQQTVSEQFQREQRLPHFSDQLFFDQSLSRAVRDLAVRSLAPVSRLQQEEILLHLLAPLLLSHAGDVGAFPRLGWEHPAIERTKAYLQENYVHEVALQELASVANLSPFHLSRSFSLAVGLPPHEYQTKLRLEHAKRLLAHGYEVTYVASETGFFDQSHFARQFKRHYLVTPGSYRKTARLY